MYQFCSSKMRVLLSMVVSWQLLTGGCSHDPRIEEEQMMQDENIEAASLPETTSEAEPQEKLGWMESSKPTEESMENLPDSTADNFKEEMTALDGDSSAPADATPVATTTDETNADPQNEIASDEEVAAEVPTAFELANNDSETTTDSTEESGMFKDDAPATPDAETTKTAMKARTPVVTETETSDVIDSATPKYIVEPGDTLGKIAKKIYGKPGEWRRLASMNNLTNPHRILPGDVIRFESNEKSKQFEANYGTQDQQKIVVQRGDTLQKIAKRLFGTNAGWKTLWQFNSDKIKDPNRIRYNQVLYFPGKLTHNQAGSTGTY